MATANSSTYSKNVIGLGLTSKKDESFGEWYSEVVVKSELIECYHIPGYYILRLWAMPIWETLQKFFNAEIKKMNIKSSKFPMFVSENALQKMKGHIEGFAPEVAWVTKSGRNNLEVPIAIPPTNETIIYPFFPKYIRGYQDLPLKEKHSCSVVRLGFSNPIPFIRSHESLCEEGHSAFETKEEADNEVLKILELFRRIYEEYLAIPVVKGWKSELEKYSGCLYTTSVEAFIPNTGRGIQGATSRCLGQNFAKKFGINFEKENKAEKKAEKAFIWQTSWAYTIRTIGVMVMVHGDDKGLVLPPKVADVQVIIIPAPDEDDDVETVFAACSSAVQTLKAAGFRAEHDFVTWKNNNWEMKGVPLIIEIGPEDIAKNQVRVIRRDNGSKTDVPTADLVEHVRDSLSNIHESLFNAAKVKRDACEKIVYTWEEFMTALSQKKLILAPWCDEEEVEKDVKTRTEDELGAAKTLCSPFDQPSLPEGTLCFASGKPAKKWTCWGRSYD